MSLPELTYLDHNSQPAFEAKIVSAPIFNKNATQGKLNNNLSEVRRVFFLKVSGRKIALPSRRDFGTHGIVHYSLVLSGVQMMLRLQQP